MQTFSDRITGEDNLNSSKWENDVDEYKVNKYFTKKISLGTEANNILVGEGEFLNKTISGFVRLNEASLMGDLTEVLIPTR